MVRSLIGVVALVCVYVFRSASSVATASQPESPTQAEVQAGPATSKQIDLLVSKIRQAEAEHVPEATVAQMYERLSSGFAKLGADRQAQAAMRRATALLREGSQDELARMLSQLVILDAAIGDVRQAVKDQAQALRIREKLGDARELALSWNDVSELDIRLGKFEHALSYARKAMAAVGEDMKVSAQDRIAVRQTLGFALCGAGHAADAVPVLQDAVQLARATSGAASLDAGVANYSLGYAYWQSGDAATAGTWMREGIALLKAHQEWGRGPYLHAMTQYAAFLKQQGQSAAAVSAEREIRMEESVVDVSALKASPK
jgi:tetratricopeptide (TPR) repeat protein